MHKTVSMVNNACSLTYFIISLAEAEKTFPRGLIPGHYMYQLANCCQFSKAAFRLIVALSEKGLLVKLD